MWQEEQPTEAGFYWAVYAGYILSGGDPVRLDPQPVTIGTDGKVYYAPEDQEPVSDGTFVWYWSEPILAPHGPLPGRDRFTRDVP